MTLRPRYQWLLLVAIVLGVYYPAIFGGFSPVDDVRLLNRLADLESFDLSRLLLRSRGYYYRPLTTATFHLDQLLWGAQALFMHVENLLLHAANASLVFVLARRLCRPAPHLPAWLPLLAALLFALHPVNSEAVCWISGRYDLLATTWVLASTWLLLLAAERKSPLWLAAAVGAALLGCLAKETALFFFGGAVCLHFARARAEVGGWWRPLRHALPGIILWTAGAVGYLLLRRVGLSGRDSGVGMVLKSIAATEGGAGWADQLRIAIKVSGFYAKKLFVPYPLNFAITEISDLYVIVGVLLVLLVFWLLRRGDLVAAFFLASVLTASSALLVVFGKMAWTLLAERYLYMPSAFFVLGWVVLGASWPPGRALRWLQAAMLAMVVVWGAMTVHRAQLWGNPVALLEDTVDKSPRFLPTRKDLANYYLALGETAKAERLLAEVMRDARASGYVEGDLSMARHLAAQEKLDEASDLLRGRLQKPGKKYDEIAEELVEVNTRRLAVAPDDGTREAIRRENLRLLETLLQRNPGPFSAYRLAKLYLATGDDERARELFTAACRQAPADSHYREPACKLAAKLSAGRHD